MGRFYTDMSRMADATKNHSTSVLSLILSFSFFTGLAFPFFPASGSEYKFDSKSEVSFIKLMCGEGEYFRECFNASRLECESMMKREVRQCDSAYPIRKRKTLKSEVQLFAEIGTCTGIAIEKKWHDRKATSTKCDHKENWQ